MSKKAMFVFTAAALIIAAQSLVILKAQGQRRSITRANQGKIPWNEPAPKAATEEEKKILAVLDDIYLNQRVATGNVQPETGRILRLLAEAVNAKHVVEVGTKNGYSGIWFCLALRTTGGKLTTHEISAYRASQARKNFNRAGVAHLVTIVEGNAHKTITNLKEPIDILFLDADEAGYLDYLNKLFPLVRHGGLILAHNTSKTARQMQDYIEAIANNPQLESKFIHNLDQHILVTLKKRIPPGSQQILKQLRQIRTPDVIFVPTPQDVVDRMLELAQVSKDDLVYDLGCGDGRIVVTAAKRYGCRAVGYDIDPKRVKESIKNVEKNRVGHLVSIEQKDIFTLDLSDASVITLYLLPTLNVKLIPQLEKLKPGSRIVSHDFAMKGVQPDKVVKLTSTEDHSEHRIYLWTTPLKKTKRIQKDKPALRP